MFLSKHFSDAPTPNNYASVTPSQGTCQGQATKPPSVDCTLGSLAPGASATYVTTALALVSMDNRIALVACTSVYDCGTQGVADAFTIVKPECLVPALRGRTLAAAKRALKAGGCAVGSVTRRKARPSRRGRVLAQSAAAGTKLPANARVGLVVGKR
jgi:hypothetical protein